VGKGGTEMYKANKKFQAFVFATGEAVEVEIGDTFTMWTTLKEDGVDEPIEASRKLTYDFLCARQTHHIYHDAYLKLTPQQSMEISRDRYKIFDFFPRFEIPNPELFIGLNGESEDIRVWASLNDMDITSAL
jgi:hypothetical protein